MLETITVDGIVCEKTRARMDTQLSLIDDAHGLFTRPDNATQHLVLETANCKCDGPSIVLGASLTMVVNEDIVADRCSSIFKPPMSILVE